MQYRRAGRYFEPPKPIWNEIKWIYAGLQHDKCGYCERKLASVSRGTSRRVGKSDRHSRSLGLIEFDIDHYRPKNPVDAWPPENQQLYSFATGGDFQTGYYWLAYDPKNYVAACKPCNTMLKGSYFPIAGSRAHDGSNLADEKPLIIFPLGEDNPEDLIHFDGVVPIPASIREDDYNYQRARVTIDLFDLVEREDLIQPRLEVIFGLFVALARTVGLDGEQWVSLLTAEHHSHTSCARSFVNLFRRDPTQAEAIADQARKLLEELPNAYSPTTR